MELKNFDEYLKKRLTVDDIFNIECRVDSEIKVLKVLYESLNGTKINWKGRWAPTENKSASCLNKDSLIFRASEVIRKSNRPLYIDEIMKGLGKEDQLKKGSLINSLNQYARKKRVFVKTAPNTYGLISYKD